MSDDEMTVTLAADNGRFVTVPVKNLTMNEDGEVGVEVELDQRALNELMGQA